MRSRHPLFFFFAALSLTIDAQTERSVLRRVTACASSAHPRTCKQRGTRHDGCTRQGAWRLCRTERGRIQTRDIIAALAFLKIVVFSSIFFSCFVPKFEMQSLDGNQAAAHIAYALSDCSFIFPITPSSPMGEHIDSWSAASISSHHIFAYPLSPIRLRLSAFPCCPASDTRTPLHCTSNSGTQCPHLHLLVRFSLTSLHLTPSHSISLHSTPLHSTILH